jgi:probable F420-dependent oxidoreductase
MPNQLKFGLAPIGVGPYSYPETLLSIAQAAEAAGLDSVWTGEHIVIADIPGKPFRIAPETRFLSPLVALTYIAAHTRTLRLATGVLLLPQYNPLVLAKELASLDVLSEGRLILGVGVSTSEQEFRALGVPFQNRGARTDEYLAAMRAIWIEAKPSYSGKFVSFSDVQAYPHPLQKPYPPIVIGGHSPAAFRRAVESGNGWYGWTLNLDGTAQVLAGLREAVNRYTRPESLGELEISVAVHGPIDRATAEKFAALGVHRLVFILPSESDDPALQQYVSMIGSTLVGRV